MRALDVSDGFSASAVPTSAGLITGMQCFADDASFVAANAGAPVQGNEYFNTTTGNKRVYDGAAWQDEPTAISTTALQNKDFQGGTASNSRRITVPGDTYANLLLLTRKAGTVLYATDKKVLFVDNGVSLAPVGSGGGGSALLWLTDDSGQSPFESVENGVRTFQFEAGVTQKLFTSLKVPNSYVAGSQIRLRMPFYSPSTTGNILPQTTATLIRKATDALTSTTNQRVSTNVALANAGSANVYQEIEFDLTDATGKINGVAVSPGDLIKIQLSRGTDTDTGTIRMVADPAEPLFS